MDDGRTGGPVGLIRHKNVFIVTAESTALNASERRVE